MFLSVSSDSFLEETSCRAARTPASRVLCGIALLLLVVAPLAAAERAIFRGTDLWSTQGDGSTFVDFKLNPIPAGFFCAGSAPFDGRIDFKGASIETDRPGQLRNVDTVVERLDDAPFDKRGIATARLQVRALNLVGSLPVKTSCGIFGVKLVLDGDQPVTRMRIVRETANGGFYVAPLALNAKLVFTPVHRGRRTPLEFKQAVRFNHGPPAPWTSENPAGADAPEKWAMTVGTNGDGWAGTTLAGTPNFSAGQGAANKLASCHWHFDELEQINKRHCTYTCNGCAEP